MARNPKHTWYVSFDIAANLKPCNRTYSRKSRSFLNETEAKSFAQERLSEGLKVSAGTLNPHQPKRTIASAQINDWLEEERGNLITAS
jgi:hypothetical protein